MKKIFSFVIVLAAVAMVSCGGNAQPAATETEVATEVVTETVAQCDSTCAEKCDSTKAACCETAAPAEAAK